MKHIEDTIFDSGMAVNSIAAANRMIEILKEQQTNCLLEVQEVKEMKRLMWFLNAQFYGCTAKIDLYTMFSDLYGEAMKEIA